MLQVKRFPDEIRASKTLHVVPIYRFARSINPTLRLSTRTHRKVLMDEHGPAKSWLPDFLRPSKPKSSTPSSNPDTPPTETSSLLPNSNGSADTPPSSLPSSEASETEDDSSNSKPTTRLVLHEFILLLRSSLPVILAYALQNSLQTVSVLIVGRSSPENLATAAFAYMFAMSTGWLIALGGSTALDTLASSAFTGSKDPHDLGVLLQRAFIVLGGFYVPVVVLWFCSEWVFLALGQEEQIAHDSARFLMVLAPGGLGYVYFEAMKKFLQAQGRWSLIYEHPRNDSVICDSMDLSENFPYSFR